MAVAVTSGARPPRVLVISADRLGSELAGVSIRAYELAKQLARHAEVEVLTTCATDYVSWRNELPADVETINGVSVRRFRVRQERDTTDFGRRSDHVFKLPHSVADELAWLDSEGPASPSLVRFINRNAARYDYFFFFSFTNLDLNVRW